jgi:GMP-PDE, delta subunit
MQKRVTPETVNSFTAPTSTYLCPLSANIYRIEFRSFKIRDAETNQIFFSIEKEEGEEELKPEEIDQLNEDDLRTVRYYFGK